MGGGRGGGRGQNKFKEPNAYHLVVEGREHALRGGGRVRLRMADEHDVLAKGATHTSTY